MRRGVEMMMEHDGHVKGFQFLMEHAVHDEDIFYPAPELEFPDELRSLKVMDMLSMLPMGQQQRALKASLAAKFFGDSLGAASASGASTAGHVGSKQRGPVLVAALGSGCGLFQVLCLYLPPLPCTQLFNRVVTNIFIFR